MEDHIIRTPRGSQRPFILFDVEYFGKDVALYLAIPTHKPLLLQNPSKEYVRTFMRRARIHPTCLVYGQFWHLYKYLYSLEWLDLVTNKKEVTKDERTNERSIKYEE